jgi:hypothetical protein
MYATIRQAIIDLINSESIEKIEVAYRTDRSEISGYPAALVFPSEHEADYHQTGAGANKEIYIFTIRILYPFTEGQEEADLALEEALDEMIGVLRDRNALGAAADWVEPVPGRWGYQSRGDGTMRVAELNVRCVKYIE